MENLKDYEAMAKLELTENEREKISADAKQLFEGFDKLLQIDTENVQPLLSVLDIKNILREDKSIKIFTREELLKNAMTENDGYFQAPKIMA